MPFGLCNAGDFQRAMEEMLENLMAYKDDVMISSRGCEGHIEHLKKVFDLLREKKLNMKLTKCNFDLEDQILGVHSVSGRYQGVSVFDKKFKKNKIAKTKEGPI